MAEKFKTLSFRGLLSVLNILNPVDGTANTLFKYGTKLVILTHTVDLAPMTLNTHLAKMRLQVYPTPNG